MVVDLSDAACSGCAPLTLVGLESAGGWFLGCYVSLCLRWACFPNALVDLCCRFPPHLIGDMGVDVQRGAAGYVPDDGGECFRVHTVFQCGSTERMSKIMKSDLFTPGAFQDNL